MHAMRMLIPPAWQSVDMIDPDLKAFYEYYATHMEPWDGPAGIVLTDGRYACCALDRNGLRPARWVITRNRHITICSSPGKPCTNGCSTGIRLSPRTSILRGFA